MGAEQEHKEQLRAQGVNPLFLEKAYGYLHAAGIDPQSIDIAAYYDSSLDISENFKAFKKAHPYGVGSNAEVNAAAQEGYELASKYQSEENASKAEEEKMLASRPKEDMVDSLSSQDIPAKKVSFLDRLKSGYKSTKSEYKEKVGGYNKTKEAIIKEGKDWGFFSSKTPEERKAEAEAKYNEKLKEIQLRKQYLGLAKDEAALANKYNVNGSKDKVGSMFFDNSASNMFSGKSTSSSMFSGQNSNAFNMINIFGGRKEIKDKTPRGSYATIVHHGIVKRIRVPGTEGVEQTEPKVETGGMSMSFFSDIGTRREPIHYQSREPEQIKVQKKTQQVKQVESGMSMAHFDMFSGKKNTPSMFNDMFSLGSGSPKKKGNRMMDDLFSFGAGKKRKR